MRTHRPTWLLATLLAAASACGGGSDAAPTAPALPAPPAPQVQLKDVAVERLPSPYYHFEYDTAGRVSVVSFASGFTMYDVTYDAAGRIKEMRNNIIVNHDRLVYAYDGAGRATGVRYVDPNGETFTVLVFSYDGQRLTGVERSRRLVDGGFVVDKTMSLAYDPNGNLAELTDHRPAIAGLQDESTVVDHYEAYDGGINVDGFGLLHNDFFDHLVLLPGVRLQKSNPRRETRTGDGLNYTVDYTYTYDSTNRPLTKSGALTITNGSDAGRRIATSSVFSYY